MNRFFMAAIICNTVLFAVGMADPELEHLLEPVHTAFLLLFAVEIAWRLKQRERGGWIVFDTAVIALSLLPAVAESLTILRVARLARVTHTLRHATHLRHLSVLRIFTIFRKTPTKTTSELVH